jgi:hypothetical protein
MINGTTLLCIIAAFGVGVLFMGLVANFFFKSAIAESDIRLKNAEAAQRTAETLQRNAQDFIEGRAKEMTQEIGNERDAAVLRANQHENSFKKLGDIMAEAQRLVATEELPANHPFVEMIIGRQKPTTATTLLKAAAPKS